MVKKNPPATAAYISTCHSEVIEDIEIDVPSVSSYVGGDITAGILAF